MREWQATPSAIPWGAPSLSPCARGSHGHLQESPAFREKLRFLPCSVQSQILCKTYVGVTNVVPRDRSRRRCIEGANGNFNEQQKRTCCRVAAQEEKTKKPGGHTINTVSNTYVRAETIPPTCSSMRELCQSVITTHTSFLLRLQTQHFWNVFLRLLIKSVDQNMQRVRDTNK